MSQRELHPHSVTRVTSWLVAEHDRLGQIGGEAEGTRLARDLADTFVQSVNQHNEASLGLAHRPDTEVRNQPAPDFVYQDPRRKLTVVVEVKRAWCMESQERTQEREQFLGRVKRKLPSEFRGAYAVLFGPSWRPPSGGSQKGETRDALAARCAGALVKHAPELPTVSSSVPSRVRYAELIATVWAGECHNEEIAEQAVDLRDVCGGFAVRYDENAQPAELVALPCARPKGHGDPVWYRGLVRSANGKLRPYRDGGAETIFLLDCRLQSDLFPASPCDLRGHHERAAVDPKGLSPIGLRRGDFPSISHIFACELDAMGIRVTKVWRDCSARLQTPDGWLIQPQGWYDDQ